MHFSCSKTVPWHGAESDSASHIYTYTCCYPEQKQLKKEDIWPTTKVNTWISAAGQVIPISVTLSLLVRIDNAELVLDQQFDLI